MYQPFTQEVVFNGGAHRRRRSTIRRFSARRPRAIRELDPKQLIENVATLEQVRDATVAPRRLNALFIASFGMLAMVIAMVGIAGVLAFSVSSRTSEIGIRMSLGADAGRVHRMMLGEGGTLLADRAGRRRRRRAVASRLLRGLLFGVAPHDPTTLVAVRSPSAASGCRLLASRAARGSRRSRGRAALGMILQPLTD